MEIPQDVIYDFIYGHAFLIPDIICSNICASVDGMALLTFSYLESKRLFEQPLKLLHSWTKDSVTASFESAPCGKDVKGYNEVDVRLMTINGQKFAYFIDMA